MADTFVSALGGDDSNDGLSLVTAKKTIQAGHDAAGLVDTIFVHPGVYNEAVDGAFGQGKLFQGIGKVILDGQNIFLEGINSFNTLNTIKVDNFEIKNFVTNGISDNSFSTASGLITNCIIHNCGTAIFSTNVADTDLNFNTIYDCNIGIQFDNGGSTIINNTIYNCSTYGIYINDNTYSTGTYQMKDNILSQNGTAIRIDNIAGIGSGDLDFNLYDVASGQFYGSDGISSFPTLSGWQNSTGEDASSIDDVPLFANTDEAIFSILSGSLAESGSSVSKYIGSRKTEIGWYTQDIMLSGISLTDASVVDITSIVSGIRLDLGKSSGIIELGEIDLGASKDIFSFLEIVNEDILAGKLIDADISDNTLTSGTLTMEFRAAETASGLSSGSYIEFDMRENFSPGALSGRFIQSRIILNG